MKKIICMIFIMLLVLTGCSNPIESFSQNVTMYNNKEQAVAELLTLKEEMVKNNEEAAKYFKKINNGIEPAKLLEEKLLGYFKDTKVIKHNITDMELDTHFNYNALVYKTQLLVDIDNSIKEELNKNAELNKEEVKQKVTEDILSSLKVDYFMGPTLLEQNFSYKLKDGTYRVFVLEWSKTLYNTYVDNYLEVLNEDKI